ncbi:copper homeostasis protein CutC [Aureimonas jatrophae]|uniref:PF03932 family protein CutC n=1 Tax=Aureimonas jatrophae TaxID=1166073 RepID=A0A1H0EWS1_9HYPH|nr:copper homeostasis protein CutC [Aureimonas jatrophae]MBB3950278.1 copper homeostasis protein [Aureimonas jatrophae]SDN86844.1 copper homeostasis protein [Aureimonas jatrophae]
MRRPLLEICVDTPEGLAAALRGGADRIELCSSLALGGLTPTPGLIALAARADVPVYAMIRSRSGSFRYSAAELDAMRLEIEAVRRAGLAGVVFGANHADGRLDRDALSALLAASDGLGRTLHRAFDLAPDLGEALETAVSLGFERVLTSGGALRAPDAVPMLARLVQQAAGRIAVMPGSGVRAGNAAALLRETRASEIHASGRRPLPSDPEMARWGFDVAEPADTSEDEVRRLRAAIDAP